MHSKLDALSVEVASILSRLETVEDLCMYDMPFSLKEPSTDGRAPGIVKLDVFNSRAVDAMDAMDEDVYRKMWTCSDPEPLVSAVPEPTTEDSSRAPPPPHQAH